MIATHLLQSTACVGIAAILALALKRAPARTRYGIWLFASLKFLVPLSLFTAVGAYFSTWTPTLTTPTVSVAMRWLDRSLLVWGFDEAATGGSAGLSWRRKPSGSRHPGCPLGDGIREPDTLALEAMARTDAAGSRPAAHRRGP